MTFPKEFYYKIAEKILEKEEKKIKFHSISDLSLKITSLFFKLKKNILIIVNKKEDIPIFKNDISIFSGKKLFSFPKWDKAIVDEFSPSVDITSQRINTYFSFLDNKKNIYIVEKESLKEKVVCSERFNRWIKKIKLNDVSYGRNI